MPIWLLILPNPAGVLFAASYLLTRQECESELIWRQANAVCVHSQYPTRRIYKDGPNWFELSARLQNKEITLIQKGQP